VTVLPSSSESLSNAILESMAAGVPVIASDVGGNRELLGRDRGMLVPHGDIQALESAMEKFASDLSLGQTLSRNARRFAQENFTIDRMRKKHEELYADLLERKGWHARFAILRSGRKQPAKMRVAIVAASLRYVGGQSVQADLLLKHWHRDPEVHLKFIPIDPEFPRPLKWASNVPVLRTVLRTPIYAWHLWRGLEHVDIAHVFSASYWSFLVAPVPAWLAARLRNKKVLLHYHSGEARDHLRRFRTAVPMLKGMQALVVPSQYLLDVFHEFGLNAEVIPNIVDSNDFSFRERQTLRPHLVCTRGFHPYYRVDLVVKAFAEVQKIYPDARLDLAGGGPLEGQIRELVAGLKLPGVKFLGVISRKEIGKVYDGADIFVNASNVDNMPVSVMEAFASGTPVVTTSPEGMRYLVDHERTGLLSPMDDAMALARSVLRVLQENGLGSRLAANAYEESSRYRWKAVREQWLSAYRALAPESSEGVSAVKSAGEK
jgi:glycosyltransferase involved in cell wall biosynthesis